MKQATVWGIPFLGNALQGKTRARQYIGDCQGNRRRIANECEASFWGVFRAQHRLLWWLPSSLSLLQVTELDMLGELFLVYSVCLLMLSKEHHRTDVPSPRMRKSLQFLNTQLTQSFRSPYPNCPPQETSDLRVRAVAHWCNNLQSRTCCHKVRSGRASIQGQTH